MNDQGRWSSKLPPNEDPDLPGAPAAVLLGYVDDACGIADLLGRELHTIQMDNFFAESVFLGSDTSHHAYADIPLTFSPNTFEPAQHVAFSNVEYLRALAAHLESHHPETAMTANALAKGPAMFGFPFLAALPFEMGTPNFNSAEPEWNYRRTLAGPRPVPPAESVVSIVSQGTAAEIEAFCDDFMHRSLAYGFYPGLYKLMMAIDEEHFDELIEMLRPKHIQMIPILDALALAGWRPRRSWWNVLVTTPPQACTSRSTTSPTRSSPTSSR